MVDTGTEESSTLDDDPISLQAYDVGRRYPTVTIVDQQLRHRRALRAVVGSVMGVSLTVLLLAAIRHGSGEASAHASRSTSAVTSWSAPTPTRNTAPWSSVDTESSTSPSGTITALPGAGPLIIDGRRATAATVVVPCGQHVLRAGRGAPRSVVVPCGGSLNVERNGTTTVR